jgi:hypothetical protein
MKRMLWIGALLFFPALAVTQVIIPGGQAPAYLPPTPVAPVIVGGEGNLFVDSSGQVVIDPCLLNTSTTDNCLMG